MRVLRIAARILLHVEEVRGPEVGVALRVPVSTLRGVDLRLEKRRVRSPSSRSIVPLYLAERPRTFETTICRTETLMPEWARVDVQLFVFHAMSSLLSL